MTLNNISYVVLLNLAISKNSEFGQFKNSRKTNQTIYKVLGTNRGSDA